MSESLFNISVDLARLMNQRTDLEAELSVAPTITDQVRIGNALEALEALIRDEAKPNSVAKVDRCRSYDLHAKMMEDAAEAEEKKQAGNRKLWADRRALLRRIAAFTMEETGQDRLEGKLGCIRFQTNGGPEPPPLISQPDLVPDSLCTFTLSMTGAERTRVLADCPWLRIFGGFKREPSNALIREALLQPCPACDGTGMIALERGEQSDCPSCRGSCRASVPGCSLQERGRHVRIA